MKTNIRNILLGALLAIGFGVPYLQAADVKISALPSGSALAGNEYIPAVQSGATVKTQPAAIATYLLSGSATTEVLANNAGAFDGDAGFTFNATNNSVDLGGATLTASDPVLDLSQTWNSGAVTFSGLNLNVTNTASAAASRLQTWQVAGTTVAEIVPRGAITFPSSSVSSTGITQPGIGNWNGTLGIWGSGGALSVAVSATSVNMSSAHNLAWNSDASIFREAADTLAFRRSTNANTVRVYDTYTDPSNYGRLALNTSLTGDWVQVAAETAGTGADNYNISLSPSGTGAVQIGDVDAASPAARVIQFQGARGGTDSNVAAVTATIQGSLGTGTGTVGDLVFKTGTVAASGTTAHTATARLTINSTKAVFAVPPVIPSYTVGALPSASAVGAGARALVTDALTPVFGSVISAGGSAVVPVYSDGTDWRAG